MKKQNKFKKIDKVEIKEEVKSTVFEKLYFYFFIILPFIYSDKLVDPVLLPRQFFLTLFVSIIGITILYNVSINKIKPDFQFLKSPLLLSFFIFNGLILISFFHAKVISESIYTFSKVFIETLFLIFTIYLLIQNQLRIINLSKYIFYFIVVVVLISGYQFLNLTSLEGSFSEKIYSINSTIGHKNLVSSLLFLAFPFLINGLFISKNWKKASILILIILLLLIWFLQTRTVLIGLIISIIILAVLVGFKYQKVKSSFSIKSILFFSIISIFILSIITLLNKEKFTRLFNVDSVIERFSMWKNTIEIIKDNFYTGVGAGNWQVYFPKNGLDNFPDQAVRNGMTTFQRPHNDFLWILSEEGIFGFLVYVLIFVITIIYLIRLYKNTMVMNKIILYSAFIAFFIGYIFIASVDFPFERIEHQLIVYLIISIVFSTHYARLNKDSKTVSSSIWLLFISPILLSFTVTFNRIKGEYHNHLLYSAHSISNWNLMIEEANKTENKFYKIDPTSVPIDWYKGVAQFTLGNKNEARVSFESAYLSTPYNIHVLNNLASSYASLDTPLTSKAIEYYQKVLTISSSFEEAILNLSAIYYNTKQYEKAYSTILKCNEKSIDPKYIKFLYPILIEKMNFLIEKEKNEVKKQKLIQIKFSYDLLMKLFFEAKSHNKSFDTYILKN